MASEIRVDKINSLSGVGTVTLSPTGVDIAGITTASTLRATTGIITTLQVGTISGDGSALTGVASTENIRTNTNATFLQNINVSGSTTTGSLVSGGAISGTTGTFTGDVDIADKIVHTGDTNTAIRFPAADTVSVETGGSERARINSDGQLLVGTTETSPYANRTGLFNKNGGNYVSVTTDSSNDCGIVFGDGTANNSANYESYIAHSNSTNDLSLYTNQGGKHLRVKQGGNVEISDGDLVIGTSGHGIDFSATSDASGMTSELLDDYEEGTFSPIPDAGGGVSFTYAYNNGWYTKIGNTVTFQIYLMFYASSISSGNAGNGVAIQGLPFTIKNNDRYNPAFTIGRTYNFDIDSDQRIYAYGDYNSTNIRMIIQTDDSTGSILTAGQVDQSTCLTFISGTYQI